MVYLLVVCASTILDRKAVNPEKKKKISGLLVVVLLLLLVDDDVDVDL